MSPCGSIRRNFVVRSKNSYYAVNDFYCQFLRAKLRQIRQLHLQQDTPIYDMCNTLINKDNKRKNVCFRVSVEKLWFISQFQCTLIIKCGRCMHSLDNNTTGFVKVTSYSQ